MRAAAIILLLVVACDSGGELPECNVAHTPPDAGGHYLINPETLTCDKFQWGCVPVQTPPRWGSCDSSCRGVLEPECMENVDCRVARDYTTNAFLGCYPLSGTAPTVAPCNELDAEPCSTRSDCTALHDEAPGTLFHACADESPL